MTNQLSQKKVKTRKVHQCQACGDRQEVGASLERTVHTEDGQIYSCYWCYTCVGFMAKMDAQDLEDGFNFDIWECDGYKEYCDKLMLAGQVERK